MGYNWLVKRLLEMLALIILIVVFNIIGAAFPSLLFLSVLLCGVCMTLLVVRTNDQAGFFFLFIIYLFSFIFSKDVVLSTVVLFAFTLPGLAIGYGFKHKWHFEKMFIVSSGSYLITLILSILFLNTVEDTSQIDNFIQWIVGNFTDFVKQGEIYFDQMAQFIGQNVPEGNIFTLMKGLIEQFEYMIRMTMPSFLILVSIVYGYFTYVISKAVIKLMGYDMEHLKSFNELRANKSMSAILVLSLALSMLVKNEVISAAFANISILLWTIFIFFGLSVIDYYVKKAGIPGVLRVIIYLIVLSISLLLGAFIPVLHPTNFLVFIAIIDAVVDFRKLKDEGVYYGS